MRVNFLRITCTVAATLLLAACSQDDVTDGNALSEGQYPLEIASVAVSVEGSEQAWGDNTPQTRVSEKTEGMSSKWDGNETIHVKLGNQETAYEVADANGSLNLTGDQLYWTKRTDNVMAWYASPETDGTINLANQSNKLAYVLQATVNNASCDNPVTLNFTHALAKVRVMLEGDKKDDVTEVKIQTHTSCTLNADGTLTDYGTEDFIPMVETTYSGAKCWEANVVPGKTIEKFQVNGAEGTLTKSVNPEVGKWHKITIDVKPAGPTPITPGETITEGDYIMTGNISQGVTLNGDNIKLTLKDVTFSGDNSAIHITGGTPTIIVKGTNNYLTTTADKVAGIWLDGENSNVKITGDGSSSSCIKIESGSAAIGTHGVRNSVKNSGNITIENVKIIANVKQAGAAAIGFGQLYGKGSNQKIGNITITNTEIEATLTEDQGFPYGAVVGGCGGGEGTYTMGNIRITTTDPSMTPQSYFSECTCGDVLAGFPSSTYPITVNRGKIYWNGVEQIGNITK